MAMRMMTQQISICHAKHSPAVTSDYYGAPGRVSNVAMPTRAVVTMIGTSPNNWECLHN